MMMCSFLNKKGPDTQHAHPAPVSVWFGLQLEALQAAQSGAHGVELAAAGLLVAVDGFEFHGQIAQQVETFVELVSNEQGHVDGFFHGVFGFVGCG